MDGRSPLFAGVVIILWGRAGEKGGEGRRDGKAGSGGAREESLEGSGGRPKNPRGGRRSTAH